MTVTTLAVIITVVLALAATGVYAYATRDLGRHVADPLTAQEYAARAREPRHEENGYGAGFFPAPTIPSRAAVLASMGPLIADAEPAAAREAQMSPAGRTPLASQATPVAGTRPGAPQGDTEPESEPSGAPAPAPVTWTSSEHLAAEVWATRPWADDTGSFEAIAAGWS